MLVFYLLFFYLCILYYFAEIKTVENRKRRVQRISVGRNQVTRENSLENKILNLVIS